jgi:hypothetical protein
VRTVNVAPGADAHELAGRERRALLDVLQQHLECDLVCLERRRWTAECTRLVACRVRVRVRVRARARVRVRARA